MVLWKNLKLALKKENADMRRERFTTGGGPPKKSKSDELSDLLSGIIEQQQPLDGIPDNDHLDSSDEDLSTNGKYSKETKLVTSFAKCIIFHFSIICGSYSVLFFSEERNMNRLEESVHSECASSTSAVPSKSEGAATSFQHGTKKMTIHE